MLNKIKRLLKGTSKGNEFVVSDQLTEEVIQDKNFPFLVSFPRTGSHWLRMMMELYFEMPSLKLIFSEEFKNARDFTCYHRHDEDLELEWGNVLYLYRNPVPTVFSQMKFYSESIDDQERIIYWATLYGKHLKKWLYESPFAEKKTVLTYEGLRKNITIEFEKVCNHFGKPFDKERILAIADEVSKEKIKSKTKHDNRVVNLSANYDDLRETFKQKYTNLVMDTTFKQDERLSQFF